MENENVCRTCLQILGVNAVTHLNTTEDDSDSISLRQKLQACVPELTVDIVHDPVICETCYAAIILAYQFKSSCLENEKTLYKFIKQRQQNSYDLLTTSDLLKIVRKDINEEHSYSFVEKPYSNGHISDTESDDESVQLKLPTTIQNSLEDLVKQALSDSFCSNIVDTEDEQETSRVATKAKVKNKARKQSVENGDVTKSPGASISPKKVDKPNTRSKTPKKEVVESSTSSVNIEDKQTTKTRGSRSKKEDSGADLTPLCNSSLSQSIENVESLKTPTKTTLESAASSVNIDNKQETKTRGSRSKTGDSGADVTSLCNLSLPQSVENIDTSQAIGIPTAPEITESGCKVYKSKTQRKQVKPKRNPRDSTEPAKLLPENIESKQNTGTDTEVVIKQNHKRNTKDSTELAEALPKNIESKQSSETDMEVGIKQNSKRDSTEPAKSLPKNIESKQNTEIESKMANKQNPGTKRSLTCDEVSTEPQKKILRNNKRSDAKSALTKISKQISTKPEIQNDPQVNEHDTPPFSIKKSISDRDLRSTISDTIDNDIFEINQTVLKNDFSESPTPSQYKKEIKRYPCTKCDKAYNFKSHFEVHLKSHIIKKLYTCPICEKAFAQEKYLKSHAMLHTSTGTYQCDICLKYLSASTALKRHYRTHTGEKPYSCIRCRKGFAQKIQLAVHMRTHTGNRPFSCHVCKAGFTQKSHLMGHLRIHTGEKPYKCDECTKCFRKSYALQIHKHSHSVKPYQCRACNFLFKDSDTFQRHINKHLERIADTGSYLLKKPKSRRRRLEELEQDVKDINMAASLREQINAKASQDDTKVYLYRCNVCSRGFKTRFSQKRHMKIHVNDSAESVV